MSSTRVHPRFTLWKGLAVIAVLDVLILISFFGHWPKSLTSWLLLLTVGPLGYAAVELFSESVFSPERGKRISDKQFSPARILFGVAVLLALALGGLASWALLREPLKQLFRL